ncbi:DUF3331 domain-containing protein [Paraburkholderia sp. DHOC27]|uniref:DUF3331 domain-containing protein n=1 Tax=Paraburkholderia sp. DHOC27 TaxID=2303330 RepID=UPI000E3C9A43|nr:DUF3331 domain-containing protein [Paraburkholderia sp. DHOC27]
MLVGKCEVMNDSLNDKRWREVVRLLAASSSARGNADVHSQCTSSIQHRRLQAPIRDSTRVEVQERISSTSIVISLADATSGRYSDEIWHLRMARRKGVCSLSGEPFLSGAAIYRRNMRLGKLATAEHAILATTIARLEVAQPVLTAPDG